jgi:hypothetical protein
MDCDKDSLVKKSKILSARLATTILIETVVSSIPTHSKDIYLHTDLTNNPIPLLQLKPACLAGEIECAGCTQFVGSGVLVRRGGCFSFNRKVLAGGGM